MYEVEERPGNNRLNGCDGGMQFPREERTDYWTGSFFHLPPDTSHFASNSLTPEIYNKDKMWRYKPYNLYL